MTSIVHEVVAFIEQQLPVARRCFDEALPFLFLYVVLCCVSAFAMNADGLNRFRSIRFGSFHFIKAVVEQVDDGGDRIYSVRAIG